MLNNHLSETEIQQYVLAPADCDNTLDQHVSNCQSCQAKVEMYRYLFAEIKAQPEPVFNFDLSALILQKLPARSKGSLNNFHIMLVIIAAIATLLTPLYLFRKYITHMFTAIFPITIYLIVLSAITILLFQSVEMIIKYRRQMNSLN